jgi:hypothetical protein
MFTQHMLSDCQTYIFLCVLHKVIKSPYEFIAKKPDSSNGSDQPKMSVAQNRALMNLSRRRGISVDELENMSKEMFNSKVENLSTSDAASFIRSLQQSA